MVGKTLDFALSGGTVLFLDVARIHVDTLKPEKIPKCAFTALNNTLK
jgi:hypothetical protein